MNTNKLLTWGAIGFAAFAAWTIVQARRPSGGPLAIDAAGLLSQKAAQSSLSDTSAALSLQQINALFGGNAFGGTAPSAGFTVPDLINAP